MNKLLDYFYWFQQIADICAFLGTGIAISVAIHPAIENDVMRTLANLALGWACGNVLLVVLTNRYERYTKQIT